MHISMGKALIRQKLANSIKYYRLDENKIAWTGSKQLESSLTGVVEEQLNVSVGVEVDGNKGVLDVDAERVLNLFPQPSERAHQVRHRMRCPDRQHVRLTNRKGIAQVFEPFRYLFLMLFTNFEVRDNEIVQELKHVDKFLCGRG